VPVDCDAEPVQHFGSFTADLHRMAKWLKDCRIQTVVMQATWAHMLSRRAAPIRCDHSIQRAWILIRRTELAQSMRRSSSDDPPDMDKPESVDEWPSNCSLAAAHTIPRLRRSRDNLNLRLSRWTDAVRDRPRFCARSI